MRAPPTRASTTASSSAIAAPWPLLGDGACAASPTSTVRPRHQVGHVRQVEGAVAGQLELAGGDEGGCRAGVVRDQRRPASASHCASVVAARSSRPISGARHVGEPHDVAGRQRVGAEERPPPEHEVPRLRGEVVAEPGAPGDAAEVGQPDVPRVRRRRVDRPADPRAHPVGRHEQVALDDATRRRARPAPRSRRRARDTDLGAQPHVRALAAGGILEQDGERATASW